MSQDDDGLGELSAALAAAGAQNELFHDCIHIPLREDRGFVEVKSWGGGERSVQLCGGSESRDLTVTPGEFSCAPDEAAERLLQRLAEYGGIRGRYTRRIAVQQWADWVIDAKILTCLQR